MLIFLPSGFLSRKAFRRRVARWTAFSLFCQQIAWAPLACAAENPVVVGGAATIVQDGANLNVTTLSNRTIINWDKFNIPQGNTANFHQPGANSAVLNRVITNNNPSAIYGNLFSNGNVYLINPSGIVVGPSGVINTNGFTASVLDLSNQDFLNGGVLKFQGNSPASVINQGKIFTGTGGATLIGPQVINQGLIESQGGNINLLTGGSVVLRGGGIYTQADQATIANGISETAGLIRNSGTLRATGALETGGEIYLVSPGGTVIQEAVVRATKGTTGGNVVVDAGTGTATVTGQIDVNGDRGGQVSIAGKHVVLKGALIEASGDNGGGTVNIGGGFQGKDSSLANSQSTTVDVNSTIIADALVSGEGGQVILWSDGETLFQGQIFARGSTVGEGGFVEVSGKRNLRYEGRTFTNGGTLLLDPYDYEIDSIAANLISLELGNNNVIVMTTVDSSSYGSTGSGNGEITVLSEILWDSTNSLSLLAQGMITIEASIQNSNATPHGGGNLNMVAGWDGTTGLTGPSSFDVTPFLATDVFNETVTSFGNNFGSIIIGGVQSPEGVAVGSANGQTNLFGAMLALQGGTSHPAYAQLGYHHVNSADAQGTTITTGDMNVFLTNNLLGQTGNKEAGYFSSYVQLGHGGSRFENYSTTEWNYTGDIHLQVKGDITFTAGNATFAYAQIGNGGGGANGEHGGDHVVQSGGKITFTAGQGNHAYAQIGNGGGAKYAGDLSGALEVTAAGSIAFQGGAGEFAYTQLGNGGVSSTGDNTGNLKVSAGENLSFTGGSGIYSYAQLGSGGAGVQGNLSGDHQITVDGDILFLGGTAIGAYAQLGNGGADANGNDSGTLIVAGKGNLTLQGGTQAVAYSSIGHGNASKSGTGNMSGDVLITIQGETSLVSGASPWWIGHRSSSDHAVSDANITFLTGTLDYDSEQTTPQTLLDQNFADVMVENLAGGHITIGSMNETAGASGGMLVEGNFNYASAHHLSLLSKADIRFTGNVQNSLIPGHCEEAGNINVVAGWDGQSGLKLNHKPFSPFKPWKLLTEDFFEGEGTDRFGNNSGSVSLGSASQQTGVSVGSAHGQTNIFAHDLNLRGSDTAKAYAQLGFHHTSGDLDPNTTVTTGDITALLTGSLSAIAGSKGGYPSETSNVQIGHGGNRVNPVSTGTNWNYTGDITLIVREDATLQGGGGIASYAQIGNGGDFANGNHSGDIAVLVGNNLSLLGGTQPATFAQIGHRGYYGDLSGDHAVVVGGNLQLQGGTGGYSYAQIGNGGSGTYGNHSGDMALVVLKDTTLTSVGQYSYAQIGHNSYVIPGNISEAVTRTFSGDIEMLLGGSLTMTGSATGLPAVIGHGMVGEDTDQSNTVSGDVTLTIGKGATLTQGAIGHLATHLGSYESGNTYIAVAQTDNQARLTVDGKSQFNSAAYGTGELRFYIPFQETLVTDADAQFNGTSGSDLYDGSGNLNNMLGFRKPFHGGYNINQKNGNYAFYLTEITVDPDLGPLTADLFDRYENYFKSIHKLVFSTQTGTISVLFPLYQQNNHLEPSDGTGEE